ncbi:hypothetical protein [Lysinibacillus sp. BPa_S21]|uniref:hypothetical protein n=1 Tax=Lysinibacillus sp. BPa_S21 TaxID=2932478 RepID=UPI00201258C8|nr:hypothetical protein [Lysinibacillus sp. BPa_S21]MCL1696359.1 hypothetical protein [Lysinibacillus sp. BPa_S21]
MTKFKEVLELPVDDLKARREILEEELSLVVSELASVKITEEVLSQLKTELNDLPFTQLDLEWDFYPESDDEGGSVYYPSDLNIKHNGKLEGYGVDDIEDFPVKVKSKYSESIYDYTLRDVLMEVLCDYSSDLYDYNVYSISIDLSEAK